MNQSERLNYLVKKFIDESGYDIAFRKNDDEENRVILRSLMNVRMPRETDAEALRIQDEYLQERNREKQIVTPADIPTLADQGSTLPFAERISLWQGDITRLQADAVVNAANNQMLGCFTPMHNCIDNCIHTYAGIQLRAECSAKMRKMRSLYGNDYVQPTAVPMLTDGYNLPARKVIHVVGPIVRGRLTSRHEEQLSACYRNILDLCCRNGLRSVAFCCISTGVFMFPNRKAAQIAVQTVQEWMKAYPEDIDRVIFNVFKDEDKQYYEELLL